MEEQVTQNPTSPQTPTPTSKPKKDPFSLIGKVLIVVILIVALVGGGVVLGKNMNKKSQDSAANTKGEEPVTQEDGTEKVNETLPTSTPEPTKILGQPVMGGQSNGSTSFKPYKLLVPEGWVKTVEQNEVTDTLTLKKDGYEIKIYQAPMGGSMCIYPGDAEGDFKQKYEKFKEFAGTGGNTYRRSWDEKAGPITYTVCQKGDEGTFGTFTIFGGVTVKSPNPPEEAMMQEIDEMIASLEA